MRSKAGALHHFQERLAVALEFGGADAGNIAKFVQRTRQPLSELEQCAVVEDGIRRDAMFFCHVTAPAPQRFEDDRIPAIACDNNSDFVDCPTFAASGYWLGHQTTKTKTTNTTKHHTTNNKQTKQNEPLV